MKLESQETSTDVPTETLLVDSEPSDGSINAGQSATIIKRNKNMKYLFCGMNYRFEKITLFDCMNLREHLTYNLRGAWHTLYAMLFSNYK